MRLSEGSFAPETRTESRERERYESDIDRAVMLTGEGEEFDPFDDTSIAVAAMDNLTDDQRAELRLAYHSGSNEQFGDLMAQIVFKEAFRQAWASLKRPEGTPDVG